MIKTSSSNWRGTLAFAAMMAVVPATLAQTPAARVIADVARDFVADKPSADDARSGKWRFPAAEKIVADGDGLIIAAGDKPVEIVWINGMDARARFNGAFEAIKGAVDAMIEPPDGVELVGQRCASGADLFSVVDANWMSMGSAWAAGDEQVPGLVKVTQAGPLVRAGDIIGHTPTSQPGVNRDCSWIKWTAPANLKISVSGGVWAGLHPERTCNFVIRRNGQDIYGGFRREGAEAVMNAVGGGATGSEPGHHVIQPSATSEKPETFGLRGLDVKAGDEVTFNFNSNGSQTDPHYGTFFGLRARITDESGGTVWDLADDWNPERVNPNGVWSFGHTAADAAAGKVAAFDAIREVKAGDEFRFRVSRAPGADPSECRVRLRTVIAEVPTSVVAGRLFPANLPDRQWQTFKTDGFDHAVTGTIYRNFKGTQESGVPMGGVGTGALYLEKGGTFGYSSIFNHRTPLGGPVNLPYLGLSCGDRTWVLTTGHTKNYAANPAAGPSPDLELNGVQKADAVELWGHYPIADFEYQTGAPVQVGMRAWSPFIPGDAITSNTPGAVFEIRLANPTETEQSGTLAFSFPGFGDHRTKNTSIGWPNLSAEIKLPPPNIRRENLQGKLHGVSVADDGWGMGYALAVSGGEAPRVGSGLGADGAKWKDIARRLPETKADDGGTSLAVDFKLKPGERKTIRYVLAWHAPEWEGNGNPGTGGQPLLRSTGKRFKNMYAARFKNAAEAADFLTENHASLLKRVIAWQSAVYGDPRTPGWLADVLINQLYFFAPCSLWAQADESLKWCRPEDGAFAMMEAPRSCPQITEVINASIAGPALEFCFPDLALSRLRWLRHYVGENGEIAGCQATWADLAGPGIPESYQQVMLAPGLMSLLNLYYRSTGDDAFFDEFYPLASRIMQHGLNHRTEYGPSQIVSMPEPNRRPDGTIIPPNEGGNNVQEWFEDQLWRGYVVHPGGFRMAAAEIMKEWAEKAGDDAFARGLDEMLKAGERTLQEKLWLGDHYAVMNDPESGTLTEAVFLPSLNGQFFTGIHGVPPVFPKENAAKQMEHFKKAGTISRFGIPPLYSAPGGKPWEENNTGYLSGKYLFTNHQVTQTAVTFIQAGQRDFGIELLRRQYENIAHRWGYMWDGPNACSSTGDNGERSAGWDYYFNWVVWTAPAALAGQDVAAFCRPGGLGHKVIQAGKP